MESPILMSTPMVQAILDGRKTQTRRIVKISDLIESPDRFHYKGNSTEFDIPVKAIMYDNRIYHSWDLVNSNACQWVIHSYKRNDILWVRETFYAYGHWTLITTHGINSVKKEWHFNDLSQITKDRPYLYEDCKPEIILKNRYGLGYFKRPSIFMPKRACRIKLRITEDPIPERLNDISAEDAIAEGVETLDLYPGYDISPIGKYEGLWTIINGHDSWDKNPWVWKIEFNKL
jgi:hypothetical protein